MKTPYLKALFATTLVLGFSLSAFAEMVSEEVENDAITPEQEVVIVKKKPAVKVQAPKKKVVYQMAEEEQPAMEQNQAATQVTSVAVQQTQAPAARKGVGSVMDEAVDNKMSDVRNQFEQAIVKSLDRIRVNVDDGSAATASANVVQNTTVVQDSLTATAAAPLAAPADTYIAIDKAPKISDKDLESDGDLADGVVLAKAVEEKKSSAVKVYPYGGWTNLGVDGYQVDSKYTAGLGLEVEIDENFAGTVAYSYSQYQVGMAYGNPYYNQYYPAPGAYNQNSMEYNQNVFEAGLRMYLMPQKSKFRIYLGGGFGFNKGYLHYKQNNLYGAYPGYNPGINSSEYVVTSFLGSLETGADLQFSKTVAVGGMFKYYKVLTTKDNQPQNGYYGNGYYPGDLSQIGRAVADTDFYSILGTVKVNF